MSFSGEAYVYCLLCGDGTIYTGVAKDLLHRMADHFEKKPTAAAYTRAHGAGRLLAAWRAESLSAAMRAEYAVKRLSRPEKEALLSAPETLSALSPRLAGDTFVPLPANDPRILAVREKYEPVS